MKLEKILSLRNQMGLHARPAAQIAKLLAKTSSFVYFTCNSKTVDAKQVMNLLLLEAKVSSKIKVSVEGEDAKSVLNELTKIFEDRFGED